MTSFEEKLILKMAPPVGIFVIVLIGGLAIGIPNWAAYPVSAAAAFGTIVLKIDL